MRRGSPRSRCRWTRSARSSAPRARSSTPSPRKPARRSPSRTTAPCSSAPPTDLRHRPRSTGSTRSPTRSCPRPASDSSERWSRPPTSVHSCRCCRVATGWCTSPNSAGASASRRSRTSSTSATSCAWKSPTSTSAARSRWYSSTKKPENPATVTQQPRLPKPRLPRLHLPRPRRPMPPRPAASPGTQPLRRGRHSAEPSSAFRRTTLPGGLRVVTEYLPAVHSASVGVWVGVGSRDEGASVAGAAHFLEHLLFKSTPTRTAVDIAQAVDAVGGELNAFTAKEHTCYYAHVLDGDLALAVDLVSDVVLNGRCAANDVELERAVVLEEIAMRDDDPEDALADQFLAALFGDHPVGRPVIGSVQSVSSMTRAQLHSFHQRRYTPERMVVAVAGNVDHDEVVGLVREHFGARLVRGRHAIAPRKGAGRVTGRPRLTVANRDAEQTHVFLGVRTPGRHWKHRWALSVLNTALGGGLSSRLFQQVRESRGLAYSVYSSLDTFSDAGALSVYAACLPERFAEVTRVAADVLEEVARDGITESECRIAKGSLRGGLVLGLEDSNSRMNRIGRSELNYAEHRSIDRTLQELDEVTVEEVNATARQLLGDPYGVAVLGPHQSKRSLPQQLRAIAR